MPRSCCASPSTRSPYPCRTHRPAGRRPARPAQPRQRSGPAARAARRPVAPTRHGRRVKPAPPTTGRRCSFEYHTEPQEQCASDNLAGACLTFFLPRLQGAGQDGGLAASYTGSANPENPVPAQIMVNRLSTKNPCSFQINPLPKRPDLDTLSLRHPRQNAQHLIQQVRADQRSVSAGIIGG